MRYSGARAGDSSAGESYVGPRQLVEELYAFISLLPRFNHETDSSQLPDNGLYLFFERGEGVWWDNTWRDRIVRVGTHREQGRFRSRIRQHYGVSRSLRGNKNASVFRKHLGGALLRRVNRNDPRLRDWLTQGSRTFIEVEEMVSRVLRTNFTFSCLRVEDRAERLHLERGLIALVAQFPLAQPSPNWLGRYAANDNITRSGLWNTHHVDAEPLNLERFKSLQWLAESTLAEAGKK